MAPITVEELGASPLVDFFGRDDKVEFPAKELWKDKPAYVLEAKMVASHKEEIEKLGFRLVAVLKEELGAEEFKEKYWPLELFLDQDKIFYRFVGGGEIHRGTKEDLEDEGVKAHLEAAFKAVEGNMIGEGYVMGGTVIVGNKPEKIEYQYLEKIFGDFAPYEAEVLPTLQRIAASS
ncbi:hypothetical protein DFJ74DRAFT_734466 [Hyaloraphidium curvatum]|nr:hypothetical protein DFJ74DRAFT_734466 [Hyaloraphidium curvatum]